ncbi:mediator complex subunit [Marasmius crinis-equi]|uniref:Mediator of RNA polymerase II transcription subunit 14 n=1 Tax=Marasmius crinis-equi TaxID=585013 RepID=A0ABR3G1Y1_9AGAR
MAVPPPSPMLLDNQPLNGLHMNGVLEPSLEELERELPVVLDGQVPLGELLSRVTQSIYAELTEMAETLPNSSDTARKRMLADWVVKTKKQVVKLYAVVKWARDADTVQKCMNITAFLMDQNRQFEDALVGLNYARESLDPARLRNHDLLTSLDVLTTGSYRRLPTVIKKTIIPPTPLTDAQVLKTLKDIQDAIRYRLRLREVIPIEMSQYRIADGRVFFTAPNLFETSLCLGGAQPHDGWFFVDVEFLLNIGGDMTGTQEFPRIPTGIMKRYVTEEVDRQLGMFVPTPPPQEPLPPGTVIPEKPELPEGVADTPIVRLFNFLQMMSLSYQLEILWYQAERMRSLGWSDYLNVSMTPNRKTLTVSYWIRKPPPSQGPPRQQTRLPNLGGTLTISIVECATSLATGKRSSRALILAELQQKSKLGMMRPSDTVEGLRIAVEWEPAPNALGASVTAQDCNLPEGTLVVNSNNLDFESMLRTIIRHHTKAVLQRFQLQLQHTGIPRSVFAGPGVVQLVDENGVLALRVLLCAEKVITISIDARTGRFIFRDAGDLSPAGQAPRYAVLFDKINEDPQLLLRMLSNLRVQTLIDLVEQKANYLGLQSFRRRSFLPEEIQKLGPATQGTLYIQLQSYPTHYLVIVVTFDEFRYALITTSVVPDSICANMVMEDIAWLDFNRIHSEDVAQSEANDLKSSIKGKRLQGDVSNPDPVAPRINFQLETEVLRELYSYCCARVAYMNVERQFKLRGIPFTHVNPASGVPVTSELAHIQSSLARSVPALCVQSEHILSGAPAAEAAMPNIRVIPLNWWSEKSAQVVTCVKLKYVQQPMGKTAGTSTVIRPSKRIIYDTTEAVVSFLSENVNTCVDEFLEEWARVSKMVVIAREVAQMSKMKGKHDICLLSFDLQTVEFAYAEDYTVSITCEDQLSPTGGNFDLRFSRNRATRQMLDRDSEEFFNPHDDAEPYLRHILKHGHGRLAPSLHVLVDLLRDTLPIVIGLEEIRKECEDQDNKMSPVDTFAKSAGWYRLLYGDLRHGLDVRLMSHSRVAILDASRSIFSSGSLSNVSSTQAGPDGDVVMSNSVDDNLGMQAIPGFTDIVNESIREAAASGDAQPGKVLSVDWGLLSDKASVKSMMKRVHQKVLEKLLAQNEGTNIV